MNVASSKLGSFFCPKKKLRLVLIVLEPQPVENLIKYVVTTTKVIIESGNTGKEFEIFYIESTWPYTS